ncbi:ATP phosphoribosyltransferase regulatory subunit [Paenibacillus sp. UNCCL117]|uniref:ATP phosphoribosyltransferase regulatory subunit n=1 Tax=unclassified Paenibacillus TaxID=185978 RepID=UPI00088263F2|nr:MULTISPECIES: ATP phosphoribosyltransferase regulatory subunit [unclassified Paenibacillus]SDD52588.1 ATP phosphoribosyltransferase regulatory subunit [Paenibacillus sp. cl123]SFW49266.1 ATP phosphoribosyltransferase regulatory subunit [Paenibacillus sp. UNCCL117]
MSKPKVFEKPTGVKDYLPEAAAKLRSIEFKVMQCMERWGYREIITPTLEYYDTVGVASSTEDRKLFKLLDRNGTTLVLRSDMTAPIARVVSSLLRDYRFPLRLSYHANVFRAIEAEAGRDAEFFQAGVELVGDASSESDAEVIALAVACLKAAGVQPFKIAVGHVGFLSGLFQETLHDRQDAQLQLKACLLSRDYVGYRETLKALELPDSVEAELGGILRLRGGQEICGQAQQLTNDPVAQAAIEHLCQMWDVLEAYGVSEHVMIDLTMIGDFSYYTGMTFEGYASDHGFPVCSGGRYDNLLAQFGRPAPATGFALKTNRILEVVGKGAVHEEGSRVLIVYTAANRGPALAKAGALRGEGHAAVETLLVADSGEYESAAQPDGSVVVRGVAYRSVIEFVK